MPTIIGARPSRCFKIIIVCDLFSRLLPPSTLQQVSPEAGVTVMFHVLLASNFKMAEESLFIRAYGEDLGSFQQNCVDMIEVGLVSS